MMKSIFRRLQDRGSQETGQSLVELAITIPLLLLIVLGVVEFGQVAYTSIELSKAAMAGAQYGAQNGFTAADSTGIQGAASASAPNLAGLTVTSTFSCVCSDGTASTCQLTDCPNSHIEETVSVKTQYSMQPIIKLPSFASTFTLSGSASQRCGE